MLAMNTPDLSATEWHGVRHVLDSVADCGCADPAPTGSVRDRIARVFHALVGQEHRPAALSPQQRAIRDFLCESGRTRRLAEDHVPTLNAYGFSRAQIEAMALIAA